MGTAYTMFDDAQIALFLAAAKSAINSATSLQSLTGIMDAKSSLATKGSYNVLETLRAAAFDEISGYITNLETKDPAFDSENDGHDALVETLKGFGITELPESVATAQYTSLSKLSSFTAQPSTVTSVTGTVEGDAAYKAVKDSYEGIIATLKTAIRASYDKEINASEVVTEAGDRQNISNIVGTAIAEWSAAQTSVKISSMVSYTWVSDEVLTNDGLLGYIESLLTVEKNPTFISTAFVTERLGTARKAQAAILKAKLDEYLGDAQYKIAVTKITDAAYAALSETDKALYSDVAGSHYLKKIGVKDVDVVDNTIGGFDTYDVAKLYAADTATGAGINSTSLTTVLAIKNYVSAPTTGKLTVYSTAYKAAVNQYQLKVGTALFPSTTVVTNDNANIKHAYTDFVDLFNGVIDDADTPVESLDGIDGVAAKALKWYKSVDKLDDSYVKFVNDSKDLVLLDSYATDGNELFKMYNDELDAIIAGTVTTEEEVTAWATGLSTLYKAGVSAYLTKMKAIYTDSYKAYLAGLSATDAAKYEAAYSAFVATVGTKDYPCDTYTSIQNWYNTGIRKLEIVKTPTSALTASAEVSGTSVGGLTVVDNSAKYELSVKTTTSSAAYDQEVEVKATGTSTLAEETNDATEALFNDAAYKVNGKLYLVAFVIPGTTNTGTNDPFGLNGYMTLPDSKVEGGYKTIKAATLNADTTWNTILLAITGEKDFVIEYSYDGITSYRIHVTIKAGLLPTA